MSKTKKTTMSVRDIVLRQQEIADRIQEIADTCERETRTRSEGEDAEYDSLVRERQLLQMRMQTVGQTGGRVPSYVSNDATLRENLLRENRQVIVRLLREGEDVGDGTVVGAGSDSITPQTTAALAATGIIPIHEQEMLKPIRLGLIWDKVGLTVRTGLSGTLRWPMHTKAMSYFGDETERAIDSNIDYSKLEMSGHRLYCAIPVSRTELEDSHGVVEGVVREEMPASVVDRINESLFTTSATYTDKDGKEKPRKVMGPFVALADNPVKFAGALPTRKELLKMVAGIASKITLIGPCWVMTEAMKAELRDVKVDEGSGRFLCEDDKILGYPVFTTSFIGEDYIGFGDWSYQAAGFFGQMSLIVDPYTLARRNSVDFVLNNRFGTLTLRPDAFALGKVKKA